MNILKKLFTKTTTKEEEQKQVITKDIIDDSNLNFLTSKKTSELITSLKSFKNTSNQNTLFDLFASDILPRSN